MKPIQLRIAGLHSYLEEQTIDFTQLCDLGVFGIFGPTGAGKSTVLDAMTLALYGKVERAPRGTEGTIHQAEKHLSVAFTFELGQNPRQRYRVERTYRRKDNAAQCSKARLVQLAAGQERILEEGGPRVTRQIEAILGLVEDDFTRAVVLPQGKFAEFLSLRGKDRREMLERIFNMGQYGQQLIERVKARRDALAMRQRDIDMEQQGLGDASGEALAACTLRLEEAVTQENGQAEERKQAEAEYLQTKDHWDKQAELAKVEAREREWHGRLPMIEKLEIEHDAAQRAQGVHALLNEANEVRAALTQAETQEEAAQARARQAEIALKVAENDHAAARTDRQQEEPGLIARQARLEQAVKTEEALEKVERGILRLDKDMAAASEALAGIEQAIAAQTDARDALATACSEAQARLNELRVAPNERQHVMAAVGALASFRSAAQAHAQLEAEWLQKSNETEEDARSAEAAILTARQAQDHSAALLERLHALRQASPGDDGALMENARELERFVAAVNKVRGCEESWEAAFAILQMKSQDMERLAHEAARAEQEAGATKILADEALSRRQERLQWARAQEQQNLAAHLAAELKPGQACPVCGSLQHPQPARGGFDPKQIQEALEDIEQNANQALLAANQTAERAAQARARWEAAQATSREAEVEATSRQAQCDKTRNALPEDQRGSSILELLAWLGRLEAAHQGRAGALAVWKDAMAASQAESETARQHLNLAQQEQAAVEQKRQSAHAILADLQAKCEKAAGEMMRLRAEMDQTRGPLSPEALEQAQRDICRRDQESDDWHKEFQEQTSLLAERNKNLECLHAQKSQQGAELGRLGEKCAALASQTAEQRAALVDLTAGAGAAELLAEVTARLAAVQKAESVAEQKWRQAHEAQTLGQQDLAAAGAALRACREQWQKADNKLAQALAGAGFGDIAAAGAAWRSEEERTRLGEQISAFRLEEQELKRQRDTLELRMRHRRIADEDWQQCQRRREEAETALQSALAARGAAAEALADMERKHTRWQELAAARAKLEPDMRNLEILQSLLRGNEFVEFLAAQQLHHIARLASEQLGHLTRYRYALEVDSEGGFVIRDDHSGGSRRPTSSLSGGETFLTSLALALALSKQIQLGNRYPLEFFFLDEGFGSLDAEVLETVITALERLNLQNMTVGIITHVPELRYRIPRRLLVEPAEPGVRGTRVRIEKT